MPSLFCLNRIYDNIELPIPLAMGKGAHPEYIYNLIFAGTAKGIFAILVIFLGLGGLQRERAHHTVGSRWDYR